MLITAKHLALSAETVEAYPVLAAASTPLPALSTIPSPVRISTLSLLPSPAVCFKFHSFVFNASIWLAPSKRFLCVVLFPTLESTLLFIARVSQHWHWQQQHQRQQEMLLTVALPAICALPQRREKLQVLYG